MADEHLKNVDELQSYFVKRVEKIVESKGKKLIGWDEILEGGLTPNATVMSWHGMSGGIAVAKMGHKVVMTTGIVVVKLFDLFIPGIFLLNFFFRFESFKKF